MKFNDLMNIFMVIFIAACGVVYIVYGLQDFRYGILVGVSSPPPRLLFGIIIELFAVFTALIFFRSKKIL